MDSEKLGGINQPEENLFLREQKRLQLDSNSRSPTSLRQRGRCFQQWLGVLQPAIILNNLI